MKLCDVTAHIHQRYSHITIEEIEIMIECAKDILLDTLYPFNQEITEIPPRKVTWIYRCVLEQIERKGMSSVVSYSENGISISFDKSQVSETLIGEIVPNAGAM